MLGLLEEVTVECEAVRTFTDVRRMRCVGARGAQGEMPARLGTPGRAGNQESQKRESHTECGLGMGG